MKNYDNLVSVVVLRNPLRLRPFSALNEACQGGRFMPRSRTVTDPAPPIIPGSRPDPPHELSPEQKAIWSSIVATLPATWFDATTFPLLKELARHIDFANWIASDIAQARATGGDPKELRADAYARSPVGTNFHFEREIAVDEVVPLRPLCRKRGDRRPQRAYGNRALE
jgi:hypothetical protein